ncbi:MAG: ketoacyl-ACP synthase III [Treponema sp.]|jgi:3-oxoacyl-[acyl-carrier-protein] synthase-3|nr:ketoacyl-ACP synthase III [Treponema sp.]
MSVKIIGVGKALPRKKILNSELPEELNTSDEWIRSHTGIGSRYICSENENSAVLGVKAAEAALANAKSNGFFVNSEQIDLIVCSTAVPVHWGFPSNACLIQQSLCADNAAGFDVSAACSGFIYGLQTGRALLNQMNWKYALVIGTEELSRIVNWKDRSSCILFGDGAGAVLLENSEENTEHFGSFVLGTDGKGAEVLYLGTDDILIHMDGHAVYNFAVKKMVEIIQTLMEKDNLSIDDIDLIICHQANERIIQAAAKRLNYPLEKFPILIEEYANTSSASIPISLTDLSENGILKHGMKILLAGFGAGLTWGGCSLTW